jgi:hypothetical protein
LWPDFTGDIRAHAQARHGDGPPGDELTGPPIHTIVGEVCVVEDDEEQVDEGGRDYLPRVRRCPTGVIRMCCSENERGESLGIRGSTSTGTACPILVYFLPDA